MPLKALEHYEDLADIKRAVVHASGLDAEVYTLLAVSLESYYFLLPVVGQLLQSLDN